MNNCVTCVRQGHLGNQMFQIAATIGYAKKHGIDYIVPAVTSNPAFYPYVFKNVKYGHVNAVSVYNEPGFNYNEIPLMNNPQLVGFFQSEKYFAHCYKDILAAFGFDWELYDERVAGIHVRRGDYLTETNVTKHPFVGRDYLDTAITEFGKMGIHRFRVFSDDMAWCRENVNRDHHHFQRFEYIETGDAMEDMRMMSECAHQVISNSTFGLWAYFLNRYPDKKLIAPGRWFGPDYRNLDTTDIYPEKSIKI